jgi:hypothetical protein
MNTTTVLTDAQSLEVNTDPAQRTTDLDKPSAAIEVVEAMTPTVLPPDARQALFNEGAIGPIEHIQVSTERIVRLNGILFDIDATNLSAGPLLPGLSSDCEEFYEHCVRRWLNHPVLGQLEVRASGTGLHAILWLDPPVEFGDEAERIRWCSIVKVVQAVLPTDPMAPGITATTRALGSVNTKNGRDVRRLKEGQAISPADVIALQQEMCAAPFSTLFHILTGSDRISPCPFCGKESLVALNHVGKCYGCGKVTFERLCCALFQPQKSTEV